MSGTTEQIDAFFFLIDCTFLDVHLGRLFYMSVTTRRWQGTFGGDKIFFFSEGEFLLIQVDQECSQSCQATQNVPYDQELRAEYRPIHPHPCSGVTFSS